MKSALQVVAGVITDPAQRVLLAQRHAHGEHAGLWEFPGGKIDPGESALDALRRELREELEIEVLEAEPLFSVPWTYPTRAIVLHVFRVLRYSGIVRGVEGQALRWSEPPDLPNLPMPAADRPVIAALRLSRQMLVTPEPEAGATDRFLERMREALAIGVRLIQLRAKRLPPAQLASLATRSRELAHQHGALLLLNGHPEIAADLDLDGTHLPANMAKSTATRTVPMSRLLGVSCHDAGELHHALALGADYITLAPVLPTTSHPGAPALGWQRTAALLRDFPLPCFLQGGMRPGDLPQARELGAFGIAGIGAWWPRAEA